MLSNLPGPFGVQSCIQIDIWPPDKAEELPEAIWRAAKTEDFSRLSEPKFIPDQGGRWSLDLEFRKPTEGE